MADEPSAQDKVDAGPGGGADPNALPPIGVPPGYVAHRRSKVTTAPGYDYGQGLSTEGGPYSFTPAQDIAAHYFEGADWEPAGWAPQRIQQLQADMAAAGFIPKTTSFRAGYWDDTSRKAFREVLAYANASGTTWQQAITDYANAPKQGDDSGKAPLQVRLSNPDDLKRVFRKSVITELGQGWSEDKLNQMVSAYQASERTAQEQAYAGQDTGGTITTVADPSTFAVDQARQQNPLGAQEHDTLGFIDQFRQTIGGWQG